MNINEIDGEQYCMNCIHWKRISGKVRCIHEKAKKCWAANQLNGCDYFDGVLKPEKDWSKALAAGARPSTFSK